MQNIVGSFQDLAKLSDNAPYYFCGAEKYTTGWKMHLFLNSAPDKFPDLHNPTIQKLSKFLMDKNLEHKFQNGCDGANSFCVYVGDRAECEKLALELNEKFGKEFQQLSPKGNHFSGSDQNLLQSANIGIRFDGANEKLLNSPFSRYGSQGIPDFKRDEFWASSVLGREVSQLQEDKLKKVATHLMLAQYCGEKYLGRNYATQPWDKELFADVAEFSPQEIEKYTQSCISLYQPQKYIKPTSLAEKGKGVKIDVAAKMKGVKSQPLNVVRLKHHHFTVANADSVSLYDTQDKQGNELVWKKDEQTLAKCTLMKEGHRFVSLYDDKGAESKFMFYQNQVYSVVDGQAKQLKNPSLAARVENIVTDSQVVCQRMVNVHMVNRFSGYGK